MKRASIIGTGSYLPEKVLTNFDLEKMVETSDEWITERTGIKERRISSAEQPTSVLAIAAAKKAVADAKIDPKEIELIIVATSSPDMLFPSTACMVQESLGAVNAAAYDMEAACSGFCYALASASAFIESGMYKTILVIGADTLTKYLDWTDRNTCILFGDGAGAVVVTAKTDGSGVLSSVLGADGGGGKFLTMPGGGSRDPEAKKRFMTMSGKDVFKFASKVLPIAFKSSLEKAGLKFGDVDLLIPHQANSRIIDFALKNLGLPKEKVYVNLHRYGNTSAASIPIALDEAYREKKMKKGDIVVIVGFGAGLTYGANVIKL